jgi:hypothetical protein
MCDTYVKSSPTRKVRRRFQHKFQDVKVSHERTIHGIVNKLRHIRSSLDKKPELKLKILAEEKLDEIGARL